MDELDGMSVHESKLSDLHLAAFSLATAMICAFLVTRQFRATETDASVADLYQTIAAQRWGFTFMLKLFSLDSVWWRNMTEQRWQFFITVKPYCLHWSQPTCVRETLVYNMPCWGM